MNNLVEYQFEGPRTSPASSMEVLPPTLENLEDLEIQPPTPGNLEDLEVQPPSHEDAHVEAPNFADLNLEGTIIFPIEVKKKL